MIVALDAMGGDRAPEIEIEGAKQAAAAGVEVLLVGDERLEGHGLPVLRAREVVTMDDHPAHAFRAKRDSSMRVAFDAGEFAKALQLLQRIGVQILVANHQNLCLMGIRQPAFDMLVPGTR